MKIVQFPLKSSKTKIILRSFSTLSKRNARFFIASPFVNIYSKPAALSKTCSKSGLHQVHTSNYKNGLNI